MMQIRADLGPSPLTPLLAQSRHNEKWAHRSPLPGTPAQWEKRSVRSKGGKAASRGLLAVVVGLAVVFAAGWALEGNGGEVWRDALLLRTGRGRGKINTLPPVLVGPRSLPPVKQSCSSSSFLASLKSAVPAPGSASTFIDPRVLYPAEDMLLPPMEYSWKLEGCEQPKVYKKEEACDLLAAYGPMVFVGDSLVRHVVDALLITLRDRLDGATPFFGTPHAIPTCAGQGVFDDRSNHLCRENIVQSTFAEFGTADEKLCEGRVELLYIPWYSPMDMSEVGRRLATMPSRKKVWSSVFWVGGGLHWHLDATHTSSYIDSLIANRELSFPVPLALWAGQHAPAPGARETVEHVSEYMVDVEAYVSGRRSYAEQNRGEGKMEDGWPTVVPFFNMTKGAESYDGQHYSYQVNREKVMVMLNLLDLGWQETARRGGVVQVDFVKGGKLARREA